MKLLILRHADAGSRLKFSKKTKKPDSLRPLSQKGRSQIKIVSKSIKSILPQIDLILTSPYLRALQTAEILKKTYPVSTLVIEATLKPLISPKRTVAILQKMTRAQTIAIVGHEPHLSKFLSFILTGAMTDNFDIKKAGFAILNFDTTLIMKRAKLTCLIQPAQLKKIK